MDVCAPYSTQNLNINGELGIRNTQIDRNTQALIILNSGQATPEQIQRAKYTLLQSNFVIQVNKNLSRLTDGTNALNKRGELEQLVSANRFYDALGLVAKALLGEYQSEVITVQREFSNNDLNLSIATKTLTGVLSNQDIERVKQLLPKMLA